MGKRHTSNGFKTDEQGAVIKRGKGLIKTALVYPNTYKAGMSSLGYQTLYKLLNDLENVACQRVFLPEKGSRKTVGVSSIETGLALNKFDIILFSISFENDFLHLVQLLVGTGIPLRSSDRNHIHPLVIAGGVACFLNPEPIAPFMDCFLLGEAEMLIKPFFALYEEDPSREKLLNIIEEKVGGAYVPFMHRPVFIDSAPGPALKNTVKIQYLQNLEKIHTTTQILTSHTAFKNTFLIETLKGCPHGCRFCSAGFIYRPPRIYPVQNILSAIDKAKDLSKKIGFVSSAIADHPDISKICQYGQKNGLKISFSSLRADALTDDLIQALKTAKVKTATIAPEAGTMRMRNIINKKITKAQILSATQRLVSNGIINLRLYFMIGLPFEKEDDVQGIVALTKEIKATFLAAAKKQKKIGTITLSVKPFIPKPATPFQWAAMASEKILKKRANIIKDGLKKVANVKINVESLRKAKIHALLSRGDRKTADLIETAGNLGWPRVLKENKDYCDNVIYKEWDQKSPLPWDRLGHRVTIDFLAEEYQKAKSEKTSAACPMIDCNQCKKCIEQSH